ncbi:hypothetical protein BKK79_29280 [Cupriavidus sp. USMAA2-4]|uniref:YbjN domain-containing protein n=1 Tax=Cupriavidus sp. USMAA2-4 TaxID=876364 RepID=UPI0008A6C5DA|nr:YbjN domain-containing protein [Cupriavidus sp. USMAA2-4]AOY95787.1 hypothetical protein BKK79_29280 [Cupriavidus sp. USMAA2-4]
MNDLNQDLSAEGAASGTHDKAAEASSAIHRFVTAEQVADAIRAAGCAVTLLQEDGVTRLHSASHGIGYQVHWGNTLGPDQYLDFTLSCPLRVQGGPLPDGLVDEWHRTRRLARLATHGDFLVLEMDVVVTGGVHLDYLSVAIRLWIQMMGQFFLHLRNFRADGAGSAGGAEGVLPENAALEPAPAGAEPVLQ